MKLDDGFVKTSWVGLGGGQAVEVVCGGSCQSPGVPEIEFDSIYFKHALYECVC